MHTHTPPPHLRIADIEVLRCSGYQASSRFLPFQEVTPLSIQGLMLKTHETVLILSFSLHALLSPFEYEKVLFIFFQNTAQFCLLSNSITNKDQASIISHLNAGHPLSF